MTLHSHTLKTYELAISQTLLIKLAKFTVQYWLNLKWLSHNCQIWLDKELHCPMHYYNKAQNVYGGTIWAAAQSFRLS